MIVYFWDDDLKERCWRFEPRSNGGWGIEPALFEQSDRWYDLFSWKTTLTNLSRKVLLGRTFFNWRLVPLECGIGKICKVLDGFLLFPFFTHHMGHGLIRVVAWFDHFQGNWSVFFYTSCSVNSLIPRKNVLRTNFLGSSFSWLVSTMYLSLSQHILWKKTLHWTQRLSTSHGQAEAERCGKGSNRCGVYCVTW